MPTWEKETKCEQKGERYPHYVLLYGRVVTAFEKNKFGEKGKVQFIPWIYFFLVKKK